MIAMSIHSDRLPESTEEEVKLDNTLTLTEKVLQNSSFNAGGVGLSVDLAAIKSPSIDRVGYSRFGILAIALVCSVWSAGLIFGWAPLYGTLVRAGVYAEYCPAEPSPTVNVSVSMNIDMPSRVVGASSLRHYFLRSTSHSVSDLNLQHLQNLEHSQHLQPNATAPTSNAEIETSACAEQQKRLNLVYTAGSAFTQASLFVSGILLDWQGPKFTATLSSTVVAIGAFLFGASSLWRVDLYIVGFALMGFGGAGVNLATYTVSNLFPNHKSYVVSSLVGVWTLSSLWFLIFRPSFNAGISLHALFFAQTVLLILTALVFLFTFPSRALREGERFSFRQWLPWNASTLKTHTSISTNDSPRELQLQTYHDFTVEEDHKAATSSSMDEFNHSTTSTSSASASPVDKKASIDSKSSVTHHLNDHAVLDGKATELLDDASQDSSPTFTVLKGNPTRPKVPSSTGDMQTSASIQRKDDSKVSLDFGDERSSEAASDDQSDMSLELSRNDRDRGSHGLAMAKAVLSDVLTVDFMLLTIWFAVHVLFFEFYIGTIADALDHRTRQTKYPFGAVSTSAPPATKTIDIYVMIFNMIYAVGFLFVPLYAWTTDHVGFVGSFFIATFFALAYPLLSMLPWLPTQFIAYAVYSAGIQFVYSCQFGFIAFRFGYHNFGALVGVMGIVAACLIPLQPVFLRLVINQFKGNFFFMYLIQAAITLPLFSIVVWNWISTKRRENAKIANDQFKKV